MSLSSLIEQSSAIQLDYFQHLHCFIHSHLDHQNIALVSPQFCADQKKTKNNPSSAFTKGMLISAQQLNTLDKVLQIK